MAPRTALYLGRGISFPFRVDKNTGGIKITEGYYDSVSVAVAYVQEKWTIRNQDVEETTNHVAEAIYNILFTSELEHETIPWYGSRVATAIFEPNTAEFRLVFSAYLSWSTERWEKRARYPDGGVQWFASGLAIDRGELPLVASVEFITQQTPKNLVAPFAGVRQARLQEYPSSVIDASGHGLSSRYYNREAYYNGDYKYTRIRPNMYIPPAPDDTFYVVKPLDTWMLISYFTLDNIEYWFYPYLCYIQDKAKEGGTRDILNPNIEPEPGTLLRIPSKERVQLINSRR